MVVQFKEIQDLLCVGFGPAALSIAIALSEKDPSLKIGGQTNLKVKFLEKQSKFYWHDGMLVPGTRMQIGFIKDLVTLRNPTSEFSFLNYLHRHNRLIDFANLGTSTPYRSEYHHYMSWVAEHFSHLCSYNEQVINIEPVSDADGVKSVKVTSQLIDGTIVERWTRNIVIAIGGQAHVPSFPGLQNELLAELPVIHSSQYVNQVDRLVPNPNQPSKLAVIGSGQSAAELFMDLLSRYPNAQVSMICRDTALRPADETPFVNQIFNPESTSKFFKLTPAQKQVYLQKEMGTNYSVVNEDLIESIYHVLYQQSLPGAQVRANILFGHSVQDITYTNNKVNLKLSPIYESSSFSSQFDGVVMATGYTRKFHKQLLSPISPYLVHGELDNFGINRDYSIPTKPEFKVGVYLQGCNEPTHGLSDTLLSVLSIRGPEVVDSLAHHDQIIRDVVQSNIPKHSNEPSTHSTDLSNGYRWEYFNPSEGVGGHLKYTPSFEGELHDVSAPGIPERPPAPSPGQLLYSRYVPELDETFGIRVFDINQDLEIFHSWMNSDRVNAFWNERGSMEYHKSYIMNLFDDPHTFPVIATFDGEPFAYFEFYWTKENLIGGYYNAENYDRGAHLLVGNERFRGKERISAWMPSMVHYLMLDHPLTKRVMAEPHAKNEKVHRCFFKNLYKDCGLIQLPHKPAVLVMMERDTLFTHPSLQSFTDPLNKSAETQSLKTNASGYSTPNHYMMASTTTNSSDTNEPSSPIEPQNRKYQSDFDTLAKLPPLDSEPALSTISN